MSDFPEWDAVRTPVVPPTNREAAEHFLLTERVRYIAHRSARFLELLEKGDYDPQQIVECYDAIHGEVVDTGCHVRNLWRSANG